MKWSRIAALLCVAALCAAFAASAQAVKYVALGDSYSSGTGTRTFYDANCQRSVSAYPHLLRNAHPAWTFVNATCSGARTSDVLNTQVNSVTADTNWVTITIGGNDAGFSNVITTCAQPSWLSNCDAAINTAQNYIQNTLPAQLTNVYNTIKSRSPTATVIVLSYPRLFMGVDCNAGTFFSGSEMTRLNQTADLLRNVTQSRAIAAGANFRFQDAIPPFVG